MEFYEVHGADFSRTRFRKWPQVVHFLESFPAQAHIVDIGCGNGKYLDTRTDLEMTGVEPSSTLAAIAVGRGFDVVQADARHLPFIANTFDGALLIAVLHHIQPCEQTKALSEIHRILKPGGLAHITCWAVEQPPGSHRTFTSGLNYVTWRGKQDAPLPYWVLDSAAADALIKALPTGLSCIDRVWNAGNWCFTLKKTGWA
jgi:tRNA (uracil-5-)-methyltransferase TRM9